MSAEQQQQLNQQGLQLWDLTWHRIELFLPNLREEDPFKSKNLALRQQHEDSLKKEDAATDAVPDESAVVETDTVAPDAAGEEPENAEDGAAVETANQEEKQPENPPAVEEDSKSKPPEKESSPEEICPTEVAQDQASNPISCVNEPPPMTMPMVVPPLPAAATILNMSSGIETAPGVDIDEAFRPTAPAASSSSSSQFISSQPPPVVGNVILEAPTPITTPMIMTRTEL